MSRDTRFHKQETPYHEQGCIEEFELESLFDLSQAVLMPLTLPNLSWKKLGRERNEG